MVGISEILDTNQSWTLNRSEKTDIFVQKTRVFIAKTPSQWTSDSVYCLDAFSQERLPHIITTKMKLIADEE